MEALQIKKSPKFGLFPGIRILI